MMWISPPMASTMNQTSVIGPKKRATFSVPRDCTANSATRITTVIGSTDNSSRAAHSTCGMMRSSCGATSFRPSTADSTEMAGVMTASP